MREELVKKRKIEESEEEMQREIEKQTKFFWQRERIDEGWSTVSYTLLKQSMKKQVNDFHRQLMTKTSTMP